MYENGHKPGTVRFRLKPKGKPKKVELAGNFCDWKPMWMAKQKAGDFAKTVELPAGTHEYKFVVDGQWLQDPDHKDWVTNQYGTLNSIAVIQ